MLVRAGNVAFNADTELVGRGRTKLRPVKSRRLRSCRLPSLLNMPPREQRVETSTKSLPAWQIARKKKGNDPMKSPPALFSLSLSATDPSRSPLHLLPPTAYANAMVTPTARSKAVIRGRGLAVLVVLGHVAGRTEAPLSTPQSPKVRRPCAVTLQLKERRPGKPGTIPSI